MSQDSSAYAHSDADDFAFDDEAFAFSDLGPAPGAPTSVVDAISLVIDLTRRSIAPIATVSGSLAFLTLLYENTLTGLEGIDPSTTLIASALFSLPVSLFFWAVGINLMDAIQRGGSQTPDWSLGLKKFLPLLLLSLICVVAVGLGGLLLIVPGLVIALLTCVSAPALVLEHRGPIDALKRSFNLVRQSVLFTIGYGIIFAMVTIFLSLALGLFFGLIQAFLPLTIAGFFGIAAHFVLYIIGFTFGLAGIYVLFQGLLARDATG